MVPTYAWIHDAVSSSLRERATSLPRSIVVFYTSLNDSNRFSPARSLRL